jgi:hypothetical protein
MKTYANRLTRVLERAGGDQLLDHQFSPELDLQVHLSLFQSDDSRKYGTGENGRAFAFWLPISLIPLYL